MNPLFWPLCLLQIYWSGFCLLNWLNTLCGVMSSKYTQHNPCNAVPHYLFSYILKTENRQNTKEGLNWLWLNCFVVIAPPVAVSLLLHKHLVITPVSLSDTKVFEHVWMSSLQAQTTTYGTCAAKAGPIHIILSLVWSLIKSSCTQMTSEVSWRLRNSHVTARLRWHCVGPLNQ